MAQSQGMRNAEYPHHVCRLHKAIYELKRAPPVWYQELRTFLLSLGFVTSRTDSSLFVYSCSTTLIYFLVYVDDLIITGKAIYELKRAPPAWYQELRTFLLSLGFVTSHTDSSLFIYSCGTTLIYFLVYVDDLIIIGSDPLLVNTIIRQLNSKFSTKDLEPLSYLCGVEVLATSSGLLLSQQKYVIDLLSKHNMLDSKPVSTPLTVGTSLIANDGTALINATMYRQVIGGI